MSFHNDYEYERFLPMVISHVVFDPFLNSCLKTSALKSHLHILSWHDRSVVQSSFTAQGPSEMNENINSLLFTPKQTRRHVRTH